MAETSRDAHMPSSAVHHLDQNTIADAIFQARVLKEGIPVLHSENWATQPTALELPGERIFVQSMPWGGGRSSSSTGRSST